MLKNIKIKRRITTYKGEITLYFKLIYKEYGTSIESETLFSELSTSVYRFVSKDEYYEILSKYTKMLKDKGFESYDSFDCVVIECKGDIKSMIKQKTKEYIEVVKNFIKELRETNKKKELDNWLIYHFEYDIKL